MTYEKKSLKITTEKKEKYRFSLIYSLKLSIGMLYNMKPNLFLNISRVFQPFNFAFRGFTFSEEKL